MEPELAKKEGVDPTAVIAKATPRAIDILRSTMIFHLYCKHINQSVNAVIGLSIFTCSPFIIIHSVSVGLCFQSPTIVFFVTARGEAM